MGKAAPVKEAAVPLPEIKLPPTPEMPPRPVEEGKIVYLISENAGASPAPYVPETPLQGTGRYWCAQDQFIEVTEEVAEAPQASVR